MRTRGTIGDQWVSGSNKREFRTPSGSCKSWKSNALPLNVMSLPAECQQSTKYPQPREAASGRCDLEIKWGSSRLRVGREETLSQFCTSAIKHGFRTRREKPGTNQARSTGSDFDCNSAEDETEMALRCRWARKKRSLYRLRRSGMARCQAW